MGLQEPHEVEEREVASLASGKGKTPDTPEADQLKKQPERKVQEVLVDQKLPINQ